MYKKRVKYLNFNEMNKHLNYVKKYRALVYDEPDPTGCIGLNAYIEDKMTWFNLTYKVGNEACTYKFKKDGAEDQQYTDGTESFKVLNQYYKVPRFENLDIGSARPLLYKNSNYENKRVKAIGYDLNSAYSSAMLKPVPDTTKTPRTGFIKPGEVGFIETDLGLEAIYSGYSLWVFPLMDSPFKKFVDRWYQNKLDGNVKAKGILNYSIGYLQRVNPFLRATIITNCNNLIKDLINRYDDIIYCNTDAIVTEHEKPELIIGNNIGEWKIEKKGEFAFKGFNYQWNKEIPHVRGIPRRWFKNGWDILVDPYPKGGNEYTFNKEKVRLEIVK